MACVENYCRDCKYEYWPEGVLDRYVCPKCGGRNIHRVFDESEIWEITQEDNEIDD